MSVSLPANLQELSLTMYVFHPGHDLPAFSDVSCDATDNVPVDIILRDAANQQISARVHADRELYDVLQLSGRDFRVTYDTVQRKFLSLSVYNNDRLDSYELHEVTVGART